MNNINLLRNGYKISIYLYIFLFLTIVTPLLKGSVAWSYVHTFLLTYLQLRTMCCCYNTINVLCTWQIVDSIVQELVLCKPNLTAINYYGEDFSDGVVYDCDWRHWWLVPQLSWSMGFCAETDKCFTLVYINLLSLPINYSPFSMNSTLNIFLNILLYILLSLLIHAQSILLCVHYILIPISCQIYVLVIAAVHWHVGSCAVFG